MHWSEYDEIYLAPRHEVENAAIRERQREELEQQLEAEVEDREIAADEF